MDEYSFENGKEFDISKLESSQLPLEQYSLAHKSLPLVCHDVLIEYQGKFLLVIRDNLPAKDIYWVIGGRVSRGVPVEESLRKKVKSECNLDLSEITFLGVARTLFETDPFGHGKGTDTFNLMYSAKGAGELKLDNLHKKPLLFTREDYANSLKKNLHPYVQEIIDKSFLVTG